MINGENIGKILFVYANKKREANELDIAIMFIGGIALFIYGMGVLSNGLQKAAGSKMKNLLSILTKNKLTSVVAGAVVTGIIQSSSATTVMVVGFVNAGLMNLTQAAGIIMGANVGTTMTSWIVASADWAEYLNPVKLAPVILAIGVIATMTKSQKANNVGNIFNGFGLLFLGLASMSSSVEPLQDLPIFAQLFAELGANPLLAILVGAVVTAVIQSSSASVAILQSLAIAGLIPLDAALYIIMGQNIGTCVTALLSSIGTSKIAKCAAYIHLMFNILGTVFFSILTIIFFKLINPASGQVIVSATGISICHTLFNIACVLLFYPKPEILIYLAKKLGKVEDETAVDAELVHLDERLLLTPAIAIDSIRTEVIVMGHLALEALRNATIALLESDEKRCKKVFEKEKTIDSYEADITKYIIKLNKAEKSASEEREITGLLQTVSDFERIGDHCENIAESATMLIEDSKTFTDAGLTEITDMFNHTVNCFEYALKCFEEKDFSAADVVIREEDLIDEFEITLRNSHIQRLALDKCDPKIGVVFLDTITNLERISDHSRNVAEGMLETYGVKQPKGKKPTQA